MLGRKIAKMGFTSTTGSAMRSTTASGSVVYESDKAVNEYLQFHYGTSEDLVPHNDVHTGEALNFLSRTASDCAAMIPDGNARIALDMGCAVGGSSFELSKYFQQVIGVDYSNAFIDAAKGVQSRGHVEYNSVTEGDIIAERVAVIPQNAKPNSITFLQGDACNISLNEMGGKHFDAIFVSNLLCRLPDPEKFLVQLKDWTVPGGVIALISPYSWLEEYTPKEKWLGGFMNDKNERVSSFNALKKILSPDFDLVERKNYPFLIREHSRKYQWGVSDGCFWKRK